MSYAEIGITTNFSFLRGASHPQEFVHQADLYGLHAIGVADRNTLAGVVRAYGESRNVKLLHKPKFLTGARLVFVDGTPDILAYPKDRHAYGRLCRILTEGKLRADKDECILRLDDLLQFCEGLLLVVMTAHRFVVADTLRLLDVLGRTRAEGVWLAASLFHRGDDKRRLARLQRVADTARVPLMATIDALYHAPQRRALQDVLSCIREKTTVEKAGRLLEAHAERHLQPPQMMRKLFQDYPEAVAETVRFADRITFSLAELRYQYPDEPVPPGKTAQQHLEDLVREGGQKYFPEGMDKKLQATIRKELDLIAKREFAHYFLTVHDIVHYARSRNILCQGRGSAANSVVCYLLGITSVNPTEIDVLFERFLSEQRHEPPDIDVDFEHERREEVMQYVFDRYSRRRAGIVATVIHYRPRSAVRDVGKALGLSEDITAALAGTVWGSWGEAIDDRQIAQAGLNPTNPMVRRAIELTGELIGFPRHLSQHVGGFVLTQDRLDTYVPIGNAAMEKRTFIEWDKDDIDTLGMMKVDVLALGMLTCIRKCFDLIAQHKGERWELATIPKGDVKVYDMLCRGESLGVFQVESRAQMNMLPRLKPRTFYDLVIEVAIVRPGPIQGNMVHPYLQRRKMKPEEIEYPYPKNGDKDELKSILYKTLGVPLFQEQAMRIAIDAAQFTPDEANQLRKSMATFRHAGTIHLFEEKMIRNLTERGYPEEFAKNCFNQIRGFGDYGFPESHAASFAQLVYVSSWLKHHHPEVFACGLLNSQPMGFYAPAQIVRDARENEVEIRPVDVSFSHSDNTLEPPTSVYAQYLALRLGFRQVEGFKRQPDDPKEIDAEDWTQRILAARSRRPFASLEDFARDTGLPKRALVALADADAFRSLGLDRRAALWAVRRLPDDVPLPLFLSATAREQPDEQARPLPAMPLSEHVVADYQTIRLSIKGHPTQFLRPLFAREGIKTCKEATSFKNGEFTRCAGVVLVRQQPSTAKGTVFLTIEDETGIANIVVWPKMMARFRKEVMGARLILVEGTVQKSEEEVVHLVAHRLIDRTHDLGRLSDGSLETAALPEAHADAERAPWRSERNSSSGRRHPRNIRILPRSRDFH
ncbi:error-prone DNA polymerase [Afipia sp. P52-10]|uniref:error-prone DNA polymerase n=1 Tax=Afipia sp. P52-10 TaxID=1429916 RepID=UPI0004BBBEE5|nr:error-prone DNA polymerase [Afipia sp. P52-10]